MLLEVVNSDECLSGLIDFKAAEGVMPVLATPAAVVACPAAAKAAGFAFATATFAAAAYVGYRAAGG